MANTKISNLPAGSPAQTSDLIPIARSGENFSLTAAQIASLGSGEGPTGPTGIGGPTGATGPAGAAGTIAFNAITSGTNATAAMTVGSGSSLAASGGGEISATALIAPTQTLTTGGVAFGPTNSIVYTGGNGGGQTLSGVAALPASGDNQISPFDIYIAGDTLDTTTSGKNFACWESVNGSISAGHTGGRTAIQGRYSIDGTPTTIGTGYVAVAGIGRVNATLGGTAGGAYSAYAGGVFGGNSNVFLISGATGIQNTTAHEFDVAVPLGASTAEKHLITVVQTSTDSNNGILHDAAIAFSTQNRTTVTFTGSVGGATSGVANATIIAGGGSYWFHFSDAENRLVTIASDGITCSWSGALSAGTITTAGIFAPWNVGIDFGTPMHQSSFWTPSTLIGYSNQTIGGTVTATAGYGINWSNVTFNNFSIDVPGFTVDPAGNVAMKALTTTGAAALGGSLTLPTSYSFATESGVVGIGINAPNATFTDTAAASSPTHEAAYSFGVPTFTSANAIAATNVETAYFGAPLVGGSLTGTNLWSIFSAGAIRATTYTSTAGATLGGGVVAINNNSSFAVNISTGTSTGAVHIGDGTGNNTISIGNGTGTCTVNCKLTATGNIVSNLAGSGFRVAEGSNAKQGTSTLASGTVVISNTSVTANSRIFITGQSLGTVTVPSAYGVSARTPGTSFTILASQATDTSIVAWEIFEPAP